MQFACGILSSVTCPAVQIFFTLSHRRYDFRKKKLLNTKCVLRFPLQFLSVTFHILSGAERNVITNVCRCDAKCRYCGQTVVTVEYLDRFSKIPQERNFFKILSVTTELFHAGIRMDGRTANSRFLQFSERAQSHVQQTAPV
jgi:hypothetical protein